jgi:hypothetical protein
MRIAGSRIFQHEAVWALPAVETGGAVQMHGLVDVPKRQELAGDALVPVCISCGNRCLFILETEEGCVSISAGAAIAWPNFTNVRCGRSRCHHCIVIDYVG